jgi:hypothetical protein
MDLNAKGVVALLAESMVTGDGNTYFSKSCYVKLA